MSRLPEKERVNADEANNIQIWSRVLQTTIPVGQVVSGFETTWEDAVIQRRNKKRTITTQTHHISGVASVVRENAKDEIEAIKLPTGYEFEWAGEYENSVDAQAGLSSSIPVTVVVMFMILVILFNSLRLPIIIWLTVPLASIGVGFGLFATNLPFDFMALLGFLSLAGMLIKNSIVLIEEINLQNESGKDQYQALLEACVSRMRPVSMAAITTILGMTPLLMDPFFIAMAVTIMSGLAFATLLTLLVVPVLYSLFFHVKEPAHERI